MKIELWKELTESKSKAIEFNYVTPLDAQWPHLEEILDALEKEIPWIIEPLPSDEFGIHIGWGRQTKNAYGQLWACHKTICAIKGLDFFEGESPHDSLFSEPDGLETWKDVCKKYILFPTFNVGVCRYTETFCTILNRFGIKADKNSPPMTRVSLI